MRNVLQPAELSRRRSVIIVCWKTGERRRDRVCEGSVVGPVFVNLGSGTYLLKDGLHVCHPWRIEALCIDEDHESTV